MFLLDLLEDIEWAADNWDEHACPKCFGVESEGHDKDCELESWIDKLRAHQKARDNK